MNEKKEEYAVPDEIVNLFEQSRAAGDCRDRAVRYAFRARRAIIYAKMQNDFTDAAWVAFHKIYPEASGGYHVFNHASRTVRTVSE